MTFIGEPIFWLWKEDSHGEFVCDSCGNVFRKSWNRGTENVVIICPECEEEGTLKLMQPYYYQDEWK